MKTLAIIFILFGTINIIFPEFIAYLIGIFFILIGASMLLGGRVISKKTDNNSYVKVGDYKIFR